MIKAIFFDLGGVLFTNGTKKLVAYIANKYNLDEELIKNLIDVGDLPNAYREGKIKREVFWTRVKATLQFTESVDEIEQRWISGYELISGTKDIIGKLAKKYDVYFLSDNVKDRVEAVNNRFDFISWFTDGVFSHEVGVRKPNPEIYKIALKKAQVTPTEAVFIDDNPKLLIPAKKMGILTFLFETPNKLLDDLEASHLL